MKGRLASSLTIMGKFLWTYYARCYEDRHAFFLRAKQEEECVCVLCELRKINTAIVAGASLRRRLFEHAHLIAQILDLELRRTARIPVFHVAIAVKCFNNIKSVRHVADRTLMHCFSQVALFGVGYEHMPRPRVRTGASEGHYPLFEGNALQRIVLDGLLPTVPICEVLILLRLLRLPELHEQVGEYSVEVLPIEIVVDEELISALVSHGGPVLLKGELERPLGRLAVHLEAPIRSKRIRHRRREERECSGKSLNIAAVTNQTGRYVTSGGRGKKKKC